MSWQEEQNENQIKDETVFIICKKRILSRIP